GLEPGQRRPDFPFAISKHSRLLYGSVFCQLAIAVYQYVICDGSNRLNAATCPSANRKFAVAPLWKGGSAPGPVPRPVRSPTSFEGSMSIPGHGAASRSSLIRMNAEEFLMARESSV